MSFHSILFARPEDGAAVASRDEPAFSVDLNLDQIVESITAGRDEYNLQPLFYTQLRTVAAINYRHDVLKDLEDKVVFEHIGAFAGKMRDMRDHLARVDKLHYKYQKDGWFLDATQLYCDAVSALAHDLTSVDVRSSGLLAFRQYLADYVASSAFTSLLADIKSLKDDLAGIKYCIQIRGSRVKVSKYDSEIDYSEEVEATFEKFRQGEVKDYRVKFRTFVEMDHVEAGVLELLTQLYPEIFLALDHFCERRRNYLDKAIGDFDREIQFYVAYLEYIKQFKAVGLTFCYPDVSDESKEVSVHDTFDLALANKLISGESSVVCNDFYLKDPERILVVSGPNQGGKTTFARTFGQLHYLASIGCLVPGTQARLFLFDRLFTHFEKEEDITDLSGKLQDDLLRIHEILDHATSDSIIILNEIFTSTTLEDALFLGGKVLDRIIQLDLLCVCVTFVDEWSTLSESTVSMVSTIVLDDPAVRTYKIVRKPADGLAYSAAIAEKYGLTYARLKERIAA